MEEKKTTDTENATASVDTNPPEAANSGPATEPEATTPTPEASPTTPSTPVETTPVKSDYTDETSAETASASTGGLKQYLIALVIVVLFGAGLVYALEQQGRLDTNLFGWLQTDELQKPVAKVNGVEITGAEFAQNRNQVVMSAQQQGVDITDPEVVAEIEAQALEVLINTQLLRQAANAAGITVSTEEIESRYQEIVQTVGGEETLMARMGELGITPESLRADIEGELLVQALVDAQVDTSAIEISEADIVAFYEGVAVEGAELPPLDEVRSEIEQQLRATQEQELVAEYIESLRSAAEIEILI